MSGDLRVHRIDYGYFLRPGAETPSGRARVEPVLGYAVRHPRGVLLLDTGMAQDADIDAHYHPRRRGLVEALRENGFDRADISLVVNCHLHFDHCGGNPELAGRPIVVQSAELAAAADLDYHRRADLIEAEGLTYQVIEGEAELWPGVFVVPTPGHTPGHQSVVVRHRDGAVTVLAGQTHDTASDFAAEELALRAEQAGYHDHRSTVPVAAQWLPRLLEFDPRIVYFAHDHASWFRPGR